jgi:hypothetical protein
MNKRAKFLTVSFFVLLALLTSIAYAELTKVIDIDPQSKYSLVLFHLSNGQKVTGSLTIDGGSGNDIDFSITNSTGNTILNLGRVSEEVQFEFTADQDDTYTLHFDNSFSLENSKTVTLKYEISSPFDPSLLFIIVLIVVIVLVSILIIRKKLKKRKITQKRIEMSAPKV